MQRDSTALQQRRQPRPHRDAPGPSTARTAHRHVRLPHRRRGLRALQGAARSSTPRPRRSCSAAHSSTSKPLACRSSISNPQPQTDTNLKLATLPRVAAETAAALDHGLTQKQVSNAISVTQESDTNLARISATWTSPTFAAQIANTYAQNVIADRQRADANYYSNALQAVNLQFKALTPAQQNGVEGADLKDRANSLQILSKLQSGEVQLEQPAIARQRRRRRRLVRNTVLGALLGFLLGLAAAFLLHRLDRRLREPSDLEEVYGVPLLGVVPESSALRQAHGTGAIRANCPHEAEILGCCAHTSGTSTSTAIYERGDRLGGARRWKEHGRAKPGDGDRDGRVAGPVCRS